MSSPFLETVRKSKLVDEQRLDQFLAAHGSNLPSEPRAQAEWLIRDGLLTKFQVTQLLQGKYKGFILSNKYKMLDLLGAGGMGKVFLCEHIMLRRLVAVKILDGEKIQERKFVERFYREARAVAALDHPNIVKVYDVEQNDKMPLMIIEYVDGRNLKALVEEQGPLDLGRAAHAVAQAALGLQHAHENGLVHRDVKPANLLLDRMGIVKILDLGLARFFNDKTDNLTANYNDKAVMGTADYLAPEQAINLSQADIRADIYSLGCTFYFLLTGRPPFPVGSVAQKLIAHQMKPVPSLNAERQDIPEEIDAIIKKMMGKTPADRYQLPLEVAAALAPYAKAPTVSMAAVDAGRGSSVLSMSGIIKTPSTVSTASLASQTSTFLVQASLDALSSHAVPALPKDLALTDAPALREPARGFPWLMVVGIIALVLVSMGVGVMVSVMGTKPEPSVVPGPNPTPNPSADPLAEPVRGIVKPEQASNFLNRLATLKFRVESVGYNRETTILFLNSLADRTDPSNFTVVVRRSVGEQLAQVNFDEMNNYYLGKIIRVTGKIVLYQGKPQIELDDIKKLSLDEE
jgi:serine/threonine protein kinase